MSSMWTPSCLDPSPSKPVCTGILPRIFVGRYWITQRSPLLTCNSMQGTERSYLLLVQLAFICHCHSHEKIAHHLKGNRTPGSRVAAGCNSLVVQAMRCSSFQLTHMSREDHARSIESAMTSKGKTRTYYSAQNFASAVSFGM